MKASVVWFPITTVLVVHTAGGNFGPASAALASAAFGFLAPTAGAAGDSFGTTGASSAALAGAALALAGAASFAGAAGAASFAGAAGAALAGAAGAALAGAAGAAFLSSPKLCNYIAEASPIKANTAKLRIIFCIFFYFLFIYYY